MDVWCCDCGASLPAAVAASCLADASTVLTAPSSSDASPSPLRGHLAKGNAVGMVAILALNQAGRWVRRSAMSDRLEVCHRGTRSSRPGVSSCCTIFRFMSLRRHARCSRTAAVRTLLDFCRRRNRVNSSQVRVA
mmetsp:Transcript_33576/g.66822  ORF Transcript_33576/g.66822 Transcript_33576/m.66822 type:complete len:135 (+) Transcript_33576:427-831(+)